MKAYLWPGVSCDQTLQDQRVPLSNCVNTLADVVLLHHARLPSMDDLGLSRSCGEERRGKEGNKQHPRPLTHHLWWLFPQKGGGATSLNHRGEESDSAVHKTQTSQEMEH